MEIKLFKGKALIVMMWIAFMLITALVFYAVEDGIYTQKAKSELFEQAENIEKQIPSIIENDIYSDIGALKVLLSKLEAVAFKLRDFETIDQAKPFLDDFVSVAGIEDLVVVDRSGNLIYGSEDDYSKLSINTDSIGLMLDEKVYESAADEIKAYDGHTGYLQRQYLSEGSLRNLVKSYAWGVGNRWLVAITNSESPSQKQVMDHFDWRNAFQKITVGNTGSLLVIRTGDGEILSSADESLNGSFIGRSGMTVSGYGLVSGVEDIMSAFRNTNDIRTVTLKGEDYLAARLDEDDAVILALLPVSEVKADAWSSTLMMEVLLCLTTGLFILYALLYADSESEAGEEKKRGIISDKIGIAGTVFVGLVFLFSIYINSLSSYAYKFRYSKTKSNNVAKFMDENENARKELQKWFDGEYLTRAKMVKCILNHTERGVVNRGYLNNLSKEMDIRYAYLFDGEGNLLVTNSRFDRIAIDPESPFYPILEGKMEIVLAPEYNELMGETLERVGISMTDEEGDGDGVLLTMTNPLEPQTIGLNLGYMSAFRQVCLTDNSCIMAIDTDTMDVCYMATIIDGEYVVGDGSFDYKGKNISELGIDAGKIADNFNGNLIMNKKLHFASVKRSGEHFFVVMKPQSVSDFGNLIIVLITLASTIAFAVAVTTVFRNSKSLFRNAKAVSVGSEKAREVFASFEDEIDSLKSKLQRKNTLFFEARWPDDCRRWKDKTPGRKFATLSRYVLVITLVMIIIQAYLVNSSSIWHYCFNGEWDSGVNLYSITRCLMGIGILVVAKLMIHKMLFWIARAASPKGETLCNLLDHFNVYILYIVGFFLCLSYCGINTKALTLTGGAVGVIFGIGCQTIVADILAGLIMTLEGAVHNGDLVIFEGKPEVIQSMGVRTLRLFWQDGVKVVRNNEFRNHVSFNRDRVECTIIDLAVDWSIPVDRIESILARELPEIGKKMKAVFGESFHGPVFKGIKELRTDAVVLLLYFVCGHKAAGSAGIMLNKELKLMCERNDIKPPVPQISVTQE